MPVVGFSVPLLEHALETPQGDAPLLFRPWANVRRDIAGACPRAGIPPCTRTDLGRTLAPGGGSMRWSPTARSLLGHKDSRMVERV